MDVQCESEFKKEDERYSLGVDEGVRDWINGLPNGARLDMIVRDWGNQRDPEVTLVGLRARWSEARNG